MSCADDPVRQATVADAEAFCRVLCRSITECCLVDHRNDPTNLAEWLANKTPENVRDWIGADGNYSVVAEFDGSIVGVAMLFPSGTLALCYLLPEVRFRGLGKALLIAIELEARRRGLKRIDLESTRTAHAFYLRNGYGDCGAANVRFGSEGFPMTKSLDNPVE